MDEIVVKKEYVIIAVGNSSHKKGMIDVWLEPVDKSIFEKENNPPSNGRIIINSGGGGMPVPPQLMQMLDMLPQQMQTMMKKEKDDDPRCILLIEDPIEFKINGWHHGDKIAVSFKRLSEEVKT